MTTSNAPIDAAAVPHLLKTDEAARALGISRRSLQLAVAKKRIGVVKIGGSVRFDPEDLREFVERNRVMPTGWKGVRHARKEAAQAND